MWEIIKARDGGYLIMEYRVCVGDHKGRRNANCIFDSLLAVSQVLVRRRRVLVQ